MTRLDDIAIILDDSDRRETDLFVTLQPDFNSKQGEKANNEEKSVDGVNGSAGGETLVVDAQKALGSLESITYSHGYEALSKVCDIPVMIDYLLIQEFIYNVELSAPRSIYIHKAEDAKWTFGPLWDFDAGFDFDWGQMTTGHYFFKDYRETVLGTDPARHISDYSYTPSFFTDMWRSKEFVSQVKNRWKTMRPRIVAEFWPEAKRYAEACAEAMERDKQLWKSRDIHFDRDYKTEINRMEKWLNSRTVYMDNIVTNYPTGN